MNVLKALEAARRGTNLNLACTWDALTLCLQARKCIRLGEKLVSLSWWNNVLMLNVNGFVIGRIG